MPSYVAPSKQQEEQLRKEAHDLAYEWIKTAGNFLQGVIGEALSLKEQLIENKDGAELKTDQELIPGLTELEKFHLPINEENLFFPADIARIKDNTAIEQVFKYLLIKSSDEEIKNGLKTQKSTLDNLYVKYTAKLKQLDSKARIIKNWFADSWYWIKRNKYFVSALIALTIVLAILFPPSLAATLPMLAMITTCIQALPKLRDWIEKHGGKLAILILVTTASLFLPLIPVVAAAAGISNSITLESTLVLLSPMLAFGVLPVIAWSAYNVIAGLYQLAFPPTAKVTPTPGTVELMSPTAHRGDLNSLAKIPSPGSTPKLPVRNLSSPSSSNETWLAHKAGSGTSIASSALSARFTSSPSPPPALLQHPSGRASSRNCCSPSKITIVSSHG